MDAVFFGFINAQLIAAGCLGGLYHAARARKFSPGKVIRSIIAGGLAANFIAPEVFRILTMFPLYFVGFGVGMSGQYLCYRLEKFFNRLDVLGRTRNE